MTSLGRAAGVLAAVVACAAIAACGNASTTSENAAAGTATYAVSLANPTPSYLGNYIYITGKRDGIADLKYPCSSQFALCLPIDQYGVVEPIKNLCPTANDLYPPPKYPDPWNYDGTWTFTYDLYSNPTCTNPPMENLDCPDTMNETLGIGETKVNNIVCITHNATKDVNVCVVEPDTGAYTGTNCCMPSGAVCGAGIPACCAGTTCNSGRCSAPACGTSGAACGGNNPTCCTGFTCTNSVCTVACTPSGQSCTTNANCCAGLTCNSGTCSVPACKPVNVACTATAECCTDLTCAPIANQYQCCVPNGGACTIDLQCCNGLCFDGHCFQ